MKSTEFGAMGLAAWCAALGCSSTIQSSGPEGSANAASELAARPPAEDAGASQCEWPGPTFTASQFRSCEQDCKQGDVAGCAHYGMAMVYGRGTVKDEQGARPALERACAADIAAACDGIGDWVTRDASEAVRYLGKACSLGHGQACDSLAIRHEKGAGVEKDVQRAYQLRERACGLGCKLGCFSWGLMIANGEGVESDPRRALRIIEESCTDGDIFDTAPCEWAAAAYEYGEIVTRDPKRAAELFRIACQAGRKTACERLAELP